MAKPSRKTASEMYADACAAVVTTANLLGYTKLNARLPPLAQYTLADGKTLITYISGSGMICVRVGEWPYDSMETVTPEELLLKVVSIMEMHQ